MQAETRCEILRELDSLIIAVRIVVWVGYSVGLHDTVLDNIATYVQETRARRRSQNQERLYQGPPWAVCSVGAYLLGADGDATDQPNRTKALSTPRQSTWS